MRTCRRILQGAAAAAVALVASSAGAAAWCVRGVESSDTLRIRTAPSPQARELGGIPANVCGVAITGSCRGYWCPVSWRGRAGWSNAYFLSQGTLIASIGGLLQPSPPVRAVRAAAPPRRVVASGQRAAPSRVALAPPRAPVAAARPREDFIAAPARATPPPAALPAPPPDPVTPPPAPVLAPAPAAAAAAAPPAAPRPQLLPPVPEPATVGAAVIVPPAVVREVCVVDVAKGETLKVRAGPGPDQALRFGFPPGACGVKLNGPCAAGWCPVEFRGYKGWAEERYLK